eukprot:g1273.t1
MALVFLLTLAQYAGHVSGDGGGRLLAFVGSADNKLYAVSTCTRLPPATCGGIQDGAGPGTSAVTDTDCGAGFLYNTSAAAMVCAGPTCAASSVDRNTCCSRCGVTKWEFLAGGWVASSPALSTDGATAFVGSSDNKLYAVNTADGTKKWEFLTGGEVRSSPTLSSDGATVFVGSDGDKLYAVNSADGTKKWEFLTLGGVLSSPALSSDDATVFVGSNDYKLYAVNTADGTKKWEFLTGYYVRSSPALSSDGATVFVGSSDYKLYAVNTADGTKKWEFLAGGWVFSSPALSTDGATVFVGSNDDKLYAVNTADGTKKWEFLAGGWVTSSPALSSDGATVFVGSNDDKLYAVNTADGTKKWELLTGGNVRSPALSPDDATVFVGSWDDKLYAVNTADGTKQWDLVTGGQISAAPLVSARAWDNNGQLLAFVGSDDNKLYAVSTCTTRVPPVVAPFINWPRSRFEFYQCEALSSAIDKPTNTGGAAIYSIGPDELPPGILLDPATATLSGTPTTLAAQTTYVLTATNEGGQAEHSFDIEVQQPANPVDPPLASALDAGPAVRAAGAGDVVQVPVAPDITSLTATIENTASCCPELRLTATVDFDIFATEGICVVPRGCGRPDLSVIGT